MLFVRLSWISLVLRSVGTSLGVMSESSSGPGPRGKVGRLIEEYDMEEVGEYVVGRWTSEDPDERLSLRALADEFNIRLLEVRLTEVDSAPVAGTVERYYKSLTDSEVSSGVRTEVRRTLEQAGIVVEELMDEFVTRQAIHTYLTKTRGVSPPTKDSSITSSAVRETINRLQERVRQVTASRLERLRSAGGVTLGEFRVLVDVQVYCGDCGTQKTLSNLLADGSCECKE